MPDLDAMAERLWPDTGFVSEKTRQAHIQKWKRAVIYLGPRWLALSAVKR